MPFVLVFLALGTQLPQAPSCLAGECWVLVAEKGLHSPLRQGASLGAMKKVLRAKASERQMWPGQLREALVLPG